MGSSICPAFFSTKFTSLVPSLLHIVATATVEKFFDVCVCIDVCRICIPSTKMVFGNNLSVTNDSANGVIN